MKSWRARILKIAPQDGHCQDFFEAVKTPTVSSKSANIRGQMNQRLVKSNNELMARTNRIRAIPTKDTRSSFRVRGSGGCM
jgi:hypothetical protein